MARHTTGTPHLRWPPVDADAVDRFRAGEPEAVRTVVGAYGGLVFAVAMRVLGDRALAEDAAQQAFVQAWRASAHFDPSRELGPWLATIARRAAIDLQRREASRARTARSEGPPPVVVSVAESAERAYDVWTVREAVDELPADEREVVRLQHFEGLTHTEIADRLGIPLGTVKSRSHRAHGRLAGRLGHLRENTG
jgi:RNA polymerase sigma factor (sigma-70 family)